ncbi:MAG: putative porin [Pontiellaceae bacterium]|nr:putative porin [Pontiellaceae bacterium]
MNKKTVYGIVAGLAASTAAALAQDGDIAALRSQLNDVNARLAELEKGGTVTEKSDWTDTITLKGDLRYRYEFNGVDGETSKNRQRIRLRIGAYADVNDFTTAGLRFRTGGSANSGNQTIGGDWNNKSIFLDLAYLTIAPEDGKYGALTLGKMKYPWHVASGMIWDGDVNPEGAAYTHSIGSFFGSVGGFKVRENSGTHDLNLISAQLGTKQPLGDSAKLTFGGSMFAYDNAEATYATDYNIAEVFTDVSFSDLLPIPVKIFGDYVNNTLESDDNQGVSAGIKFGDAKKGKWEASVEYRRLEANAVPATFADSDFVGGGTDVEGAQVKAAYNIAKHLQLGVAGIMGEQISSGTDVQTVLLDLSVSF